MKSRGLQLFLAACALIASNASLALEPYDTVKKSLVYITAAAETKTGVQIKAFGTGFMVSDDGYILTSHTLFASLKQEAERTTDQVAQGEGELDRDTVKFSVAVGDKKSEGMVAASIVQENPSVDLLLLKIPGSVNYSYVSTSEMTVEQSSRIHTSGFRASSASVVQYAGQAGAPDEISGYLTEFRTENCKNGQGGSPVFLDDATVIGVLKGPDENNGCVFVSIGHGAPLLSFQKLRLIEKELGEIRERVAGLESTLAGLDSWSAEEQRIDSLESADSAFVNRMSDEADNLGFVRFDTPVSIREKNDPTVVVTRHGEGGNHLSPYPEGKPGLGRWGSSVWLLRKAN